MKLTVTDKEVTTLGSSDAAVRTTSSIELTAEGRSKPKHCFKGLHTAKAADVRYNGTSTKICDPFECGEDLHKESKNEQQLQGKIGRKKKGIKETRSFMKRLQAKHKALQLREARKVRAEMLGRYDLEYNDLNSEYSENEREWFD
mmetsp:Transcript_8550/g.9736  ORF Transcript_8550/g.9736 Transcript_8550/m.9736 type:complete len:145 (-) Transcript_8550:808-1242(-)